MGSAPSVEKGGVLASESKSTYFKSNSSKKEKGIAERHELICQYWFRNKSKEKMYFLDDLCRIISLFSATIPDKWDLSVKGGYIHIDPQTGVIENKKMFGWYVKNDECGKTKSSYFVVQFRSNYQMQPIL